MSNLFGQKRLIYFPELRWKVGSVQSAILMTRLEQYFERYGCNSELQNYLYPQPKLINYSPGKSWTEDLGFEKEEFKTAFRKIGTWYGQPSTYRKAKQQGDVFQDKFYCSYSDWGFIHILRNNEKVEEFLSSL